MADEPRRLSELLEQGSLSRLLREAQRRQMETERVRRLLPSEEATHLISAVTDAAGELTLVMDSPAWAARMRYCMHTLPNAKIRIRVLPQTKG
jgi:hypothetical protein